MVAPGRGILAADESSAHQEAFRRDRRRNRPPTQGATTASSMFRSTEAMTKYISGVILYDETIRQNARTHAAGQGDREAGALPGIKVDAGIKAAYRSRPRGLTRGST